MNGCRDDPKSFSRGNQNGHHNTGLKRTGSTDPSGTSEFTTGFCFCSVRVAQSLFVGVVIWDHCFVIVSSVCLSPKHSFMLPVSCSWQTLSHTITLIISEVWTHNISGDMTFNYHTIKSRTAPAYDNQSSHPIRTHDDPTTRPDCQSKDIFCPGTTCSFGINKNGVCKLL
jgi:hypothetical protein